MKVLHICVNDFMGAGLCAHRINKALQEEGVDSKMLVVYKHSSDTSVFTCGRLITLYFKVLNRLMYYLPFNINEESYLYKLTRKSKTAFSLPTSHINLSNNKLVKEADIIHLHWINGLVDYPTFFRDVDKPIVWTLHDENLFCGIAHYKKAAKTNDKIEIKYSKIKYNAVISIKNLSIVFLSRYFNNNFQNEDIIRHANKYVINNSVDSQKYTSIDKNVAQKKLGLASGYKYLLFIAYDLTEERKGFTKLISALKKLNDTNLRVLAVGKNSGIENDPIVTTFGLVSDNIQMSTIISASDYFVMPSSQEAFAQTPLEAMACGKPAIVFPVSGTEELINPKNGIICNGYSVEDLADGIRKALVTQYNGELIRMDVINRFSPHSIALQYIEVYKNALKQLQNKL